MIPNWKSLLSFDVFSCPSLCSSSSFFSFTFNSANLFLISFSFSLNFSLSSSNLLIINLSFVGFGTLARKCDFPLTKDIDLDCLKGLMNFCWTLILKFWELISCHFFSSIFNSIYFWNLSGIIVFTMLQSHFLFGSLSSHTLEKIFQCKYFYLQS